MTPSQEAKEYASANGFTLQTFGKKIGVLDEKGGLEWVAFSGYPAALNHMRRVVSERPVVQIAPDIAMVKGPAVLVREGCENVALPNGGFVATSIAVDKRLLAAYPALSTAVGMIQIPCAAVGNKRWQKIKRAQRKERRLEHCSSTRYDAVIARNAWRVFADHQLEASCESRADAVAFVRKYFSGQSGVVVLYV